MGRVGTAVLDRFVHAVRSLRRSPWLEQLLVEYFARRVLRSRAGGRTATSDLRFLESELTREIFRAAGLWRTERDAVERSGLGESVADRAVEYIEANLFGPLELDVIAKHVHASVSTLVRKFFQRTGLTPLKYARRRRLDEAQVLLKQGTHNVTEVAILVGYENAGAFCEAFRARYRRSPSQARAEAATTKRPAK
jgi:transcriptional regulator GlxA family with amidase domain